MPKKALVYSESNPEGASGEERYSKDITIDKDELEQEIEFNFDVEKIRDEEIDGKLEIFCRIIYKDSDIATKIDSMIVVRTERGRR